MFPLRRGEKGGKRRCWSGAIRRDRGPSDTCLLYTSKEGFTFKALVSVRPEVKLGQYKGLTAPKAEPAVTDEDIENELKPYITRATRLVSVDREAQNGDTAVIDFEGFDNGVAFEGEMCIRDRCTSVGDRNVLERMLEKGYAIGGEQSGHMIFLEHATTGDGQLTALQVLALLKESGKRASEVFGICQRYPQVLINIPVADNDRKKACLLYTSFSSRAQEDSTAFTEGWAQICSWSLVREARE